MPLPRWVARFNKRVTNRFAEPLARRFSNFAVIHHRGRRSGHPFTTPVNWFAIDDATLVVALTYGPGADWVRNVLAGDAAIEMDGQMLRILEATVVGRDPVWDILPRIVRGTLRLLRVRHFLQVHHNNRNTSR